MKRIVLSVITMLMILSMIAVLLPASAVMPTQTGVGYPHTYWADAGKAGAVTGRVTFSSNGTGVSYAYISIVNASNVNQEYYNTTSDFFGNYQITGITATYSSVSLLGPHGYTGDDLRYGRNMYKVYASRGTDGEGYSAAFGIDADQNGATDSSVVLHTGSFTPGSSYPHTVWYNMGMSGAVTGRVTSVSGTTGVSGASISIVNASNPAEVYYTTTADDYGNYQITGLAPTFSSVLLQGPNGLPSYDFVLGKNMYLIHASSGTDEGWSAAFGIDADQAGSTPTSVVVGALSPSSSLPHTVWSDAGQLGSVTGRVTTSVNGTVGIGNAYIAIVNASNVNEEYYNTTSDAYGYYQICGLSASYDSSSIAGPDGSMGSYARGINMYKIHASKSPYGDGYSAAFGIDANREGATSSSAVIYARPARIELVPDSGSVVANGTCRTSVRAYLYDGLGNPMANGYSINFALSNTDPAYGSLGVVGTGTPYGSSLAAQTANNEGAATVEFGWASAEGSNTINATFADDPNIFASMTIPINAPASAGITLFSARNSVVADGADFALITAYVTDSTGSPVPDGTQVTFALSDTGSGKGQLNPEGMWAPDTTVIASTSGGYVNVFYGWATAFGSSNTITAMETADPSMTSSMGIFLRPPISSFSGTVVDENGNPVGGVPLTLHVMGSSGEIYSMGTSSSISQPYVGSFVFDNIVKTPDVHHGYITATKEIAAETYNGVSNGFLINSSHTSTGAVVLKRSTGTAAVFGSVVDSFATGYGGTTVTLHVLDSSGTELRSYMTATSGDQPYAGAFTFDNVDLSDGADQGYVTCTAQLTDSISISGMSTKFQLVQGDTALCSVVLKIPPPDDIVLTVDQNPVPDGTSTAIVTAQLMLNGNPYHRAYFPVTFTSDNNAVASTPGPNYNMTDLNGQACMTYAWNGAAGSVNVWATSNIMMGVAIDNSTTIYYHVPIGPIIEDSGPSTIPATASWYGSVRDSFGTGYGGIPVKLHVMGVTPEGYPYEVYNMTRTTSSSQPYVGAFVFDYILPDPGCYAYVDTYAQLTDNLSIYGSSDFYPIFDSMTSTGSVVLHIPGPDAIKVTATKDTLSAGGESEWVIAQLYLNGMPYKRSYIAVTFYSDNDSVANLPSVRTNLTDMNGQARMLLTSNNTAGQVNVAGVCGIMYMTNLMDTAMVSVQDTSAQPDAIMVTPDRDTIFAGGDQTWLKAQVYMDGMPYMKAGIPVEFTSDNDLVGNLPSVRTNVTDSSGQAWILLTSNETTGKVNVTAAVSTSPETTLTDMAVIRVINWGTVAGLALDKNWAGVPNANMALWNVRWNGDTGTWDNTNMVMVPENPQLSNSGVTALPGVYTFYRVPYGVYNVTASKDGYVWSEIIVLGSFPADVYDYMGATYIPPSQWGTATAILQSPDYVDSEGTGGGSPGVSGVSTITGLVTDQNKNAVDGATVQLWYCEYSDALGRWEKTSLVSRPDNPQVTGWIPGAPLGAYSYNDVPVGTYMITAEKEGHEFFAVNTTHEGQLSICFVAIPDYSAIMPSNGHVVNLRTGLEYSSIQAAIDDGNTVDGDTIQADSGTYHESVNIHKSLTLMGWPTDGNLPVVEGSNSNAPVFALNADNIVLEKFQISSYGNGPGVYVSELSHGSTVGYNTISQCGHGIAVHGTNTLVIGNIADNNLLDGINVWSSPDGIPVGTNVSENSCMNNGHFGIGVGYCNGTVLAGNDLLNNGWDGTWLDTVNDVTVYGNNANFNGHNGIGFRVSSNCNVSYNVAEGNSWAGIRYGDNSNTCLISYNTANNNHQDGISLDASDCMVVGNTVSGSDSNGIWIGYCNNSTILANTANNNHGAGICVDTVSDSRIIGNTVNANEQTGIPIRASTGNTIYGNTVNNNIQEGINLWDNSNYNNVSENDLSYNGNNGMSSGYSEGNLIAFNNINNNGNNGNQYFVNGLWLDTTANYNVTGNVVNNNYGQGIGARVTHDSGIALNDVSNNYNCGVNLGDQNYNLWVSANTVNDNGGDGLNFWNLFSSNVSGNTASRNANFGLVTGYTSGDVVADNVADSNGRDGLWFDTVWGFQIVNNEASNNQQSGINMRDSSFNNISYNTVTYNSWSGIGGGDQIHDNLVTYNTANYNNGGGICMNTYNCVFAFNTANYNNDRGLGLSGGYDHVYSNSATGNNNGDGICVWGMNDSTIEGNVATGNSNNGISTGNCANDTISGNTLYGNRGGIWLDFADNCLVMGNDVQNNYEWNGIGARAVTNVNISYNNVASNNNGIGMFENCQYDTIVHNTISNNNNPGICVGDRSGHFLIEYNVVTGNYGDGINFWTANDSVVRNNMISNNAFSGTSAGYNYNNTVEGNTISGNGNNGMWFDTVDGCTIIGNDLDDNQGGIGFRVSTNNYVLDNDLNNNRGSIGFNDNCFGNTISGNTVNGAIDSDGINLWNNANGNVVTDNIVTNCARDGISIGYSSDYIVTGNEVSGNQMGGIWFDTVNNATANDNTALNNGNLGIGMRWSDGGHVTGNDIQYSSSNGIMFDQVTNTVVSNNNVSYNNVGISIGSASGADTVTGNTVSNNVWDGMDIWGMGGFIVTDNSICSNGQSGLQIGCDNSTIARNTINDNGYTGLYVSGQNSTYRNNQMNNNRYNFQSWPSKYYYCDVDTSNLVDGKPIQYLVSPSDLVIDSSWNAGTVYIVNGDHVTVKDLEFSHEGAGVYFSDTNNSVIQNLNVHDNLYGIVVQSSNDNSVTGNAASGNEYGIYLSGQSGNVLRNNIMTANRYNFGDWLYGDGYNDVDTSNLVDGKPVQYLVGLTDTVIDPSWNAGTVYVINGYNVTVEGLSLDNNCFGVCLYNTTGSTVRNCQLHGNEVGVGVMRSGGNDISNNDMRNNGQVGVYLNNAYGNSVTGNDARYAPYCGLYLAYSDNNVITANDASNEGYCGLSMYGSDYNTLTHNSFSYSNYGINLQDWGSDQSHDNQFYLNDIVNNVWGQVSGNSISNQIWNSGSLLTYDYYGGHYISYMGNYWSNYGGWDGDGNGIGDVSYTVGGVGSDQFPLMASNQLFNVVPAPIPEFETDTTYGNTPLTVMFTDKSTNTPTSWYWEFGDGSTSIEQNPVHTYTVGGLFTVNLTATNAYGSYKEVKTYYITVVPTEGPIVGPPSPGVTFYIPLNKGWNLISLPVAPENGNMDSLFDGIRDDVVVVWAYDGSESQPWSYYVPGRSDNTLTSVNDKMGIWVLCEKDTLLEVKGEPEADMSVPLNDDGWSLVGHPRMTVNSPAELYGSSMAVWGYEDDHWYLYTQIPGYPTSLSQLRPGLGYWVLQQ